MTEILDSEDGRARSVEMSDAKRTEIKELLKSGTFRIIVREEVSPPGNFLFSIFVLEINPAKDDGTKFKVRYKIGGHRNKFRHMMVYSQPRCIHNVFAYFWHWKRSLATIYGPRMYAKPIFNLQRRSRKNIHRKASLGIQA